MSLKRSPMRKKAIREDWSDARAKVEEEGECRACGNREGWTVLWSSANEHKGLVRLQAAHVIGRQYDQVVVGPRGGKRRYVHPDAIIPLCLWCHDEQHAKKLSILGLLTFPELMNAARACKRNSLNLRRRLSGGIT